MGKILFVTDTWGIGGREITIKKLMENLSPEWERWLLWLVKTKPQKGEMLPFPKNSQVIIMKWTYLPGLFLRLVRFFQKNEFDLVSAHSSPLNNLFLCIWGAAKLTYPAMPIVATNHGSRSSSRREYPLLHLKKYVLRKKLDFMVTVSKALEQFMKRRWGIPQDKITTIYNPIIDERLLRMADEVPPEFKDFPDRIKILKVARLGTKSKDFRTLLTAFAIFRERYKDALLFIIGEGGGRDKIARWVEELGLKESVFLLGSRLNPYPYMKYADIFVLSSFYEGLGMVIVEAMALGCPVVATDCPVGPRELIGDNENGILVPMKDPERMAEAMIRIIEDEELRRRIVENGKRKAQEFSISTSVRKMEELFKELLERKRSNWDG